MEGPHPSDQLSVVGRCSTSTPIASCPQPTCHNNVTPPATEAIWHFGFRRGGVSLKERDDDVEDRQHEPCCASDGGWSSGPVVQASGLKPPQCHAVQEPGWEATGKRARSQRVRYAARRRTALNPC